MQGDERREAVERWARARGYLMNELGQVHHDAPWTISTQGHPGVTFGPGIKDATRRPNAVRTVNPDTALLACLLIDAGLTVDVGRCPECEGRRYVLNHHDAQVPSTCTTCNATGRDTREAVRLLLDAAPRDLGSDAHVYGSEAEALADARALAQLKGRSPDRYRAKQSSVTGGWRIHEFDLGDPQAREAMTVLADSLLPDLSGKRQHDHEREVIGEWLALWLGGHDGWQAEAVARLGARAGSEVRRAG